VSCPPAGDCTAGGYYAHHGLQAFIVSLHSGGWGQAIEVPGPARLNTGRNAAVDSVSCTSATACSTGGSYTERSHHAQAFRPPGADTRRASQHRQDRAPRPPGTGC
jgi:hypothetical protein